MRNNAANFGEVLVMLSFRVHTTMPTTIYVQCTCNAVCAFHMAKPKALRSVAPHLQHYGFISCHELP